MHLTFWAVAAPVLFWGGLYFIPLPRALKIVIAIFVLAVGWSGYASAQALPTPVFVPSASGNVVTFSGATATAANASSFTFGHAANGPVYAEAAASFRTAGGSVVPVVARSAPSALAVAKTIGTGLALVSNVGTALVVGVALYEFAKELGFKVDNSSGVLVVTKPDPSVCSAAPCTGYIGKDGKTYSTAAASCANEMGGSQGNLPFVYAFNDICYFGLNNVATTGHAVSAVSVSPQPPVFLPSSVQALQDAIAAKSGWPATSKIDDALRDAVKAGSPLDLPKPLTITGPLEVSYPPTTTTNPDGSKTVTTKKEKITIGTDGTVKVDTETTVKTSNAAGTVTGTTVTTDSPPAPKPDPQTDCEKFPDSLGCIKLGEAPAAEKLSKTNVAVSVVAQSFSGGGACPSPLSFSVIGRSYAVSYQPLCDRLIILKALFMAMAGVMAAFILADSFKV